jgi:hypothetical protein
VSRLRLHRHDGTMIGAESVLVEDWCQQYPSHTIGTPGVRRGRGAVRGRR